MARSKSSLRNASFDDVLPRLVTAYQSGRLVPFIGSGMSRPACSSWGQFVTRLEQRADPENTQAEPEQGSPEELVRRARHAVRQLKARDRSEFLDAMRHALFSAPQAQMPPQTRALAQLWWPLTISTNYDNYFAAAYLEKFPLRRLQILGRSAPDCQRVLHSIGDPASAILWAMQGFLDQPCSLPTNAARTNLADELVVGHEEYRGAAFRDLHFRRAFAEVLRSRSLLFLGSGIREPYVQDLFSEILELYGPSARPHYAILPVGEVDPEFMLARFQIVVVEYPPGAHDGLPKMIETLGAAIDSARRPTMFAWSARDMRDATHDAPELDVVDAALPLELERSACVGISASGPRGVYAFSRSMQAYLTSLGLPSDCPVETGDQRYVGRITDSDIFAVRARSDDNALALEHIHAAAMEFFELASRDYRVAHMQLLAAGDASSSQARDESWRRHSYSERYSFVQIVRAYADWRRAFPERELRLQLHVLAPQVHLELASGRIQVLELLTCSDMRFYAETIDADGSYERRLFQLPPTTELREVLDALHLPARGWRIELHPTPGMLLNEGDSIELSRTRNAKLFELGLVPGSTITFRRR